MSIDYRGNPWDMSGVTNTFLMFTDSCVNTPSRCEASCAAFDSTFPTTPAGYSIANPSGTTASGATPDAAAAGVLPASVAAPDALLSKLKAKATADEKPATSEE